MAGSIEVLTGEAGTEKTTRLFALYRKALIEAHVAGPLGSTLWLVPTARAQKPLLERLGDGSLPVLFSPNVLTFQDFAERILRAGPTTATALSPAMRRMLMRRIVDRLNDDGQLRHFSVIAPTAGFLDLVTAFIAELKRTETWPENFTAACARRGVRPGDRELAAIYTAYQEALLDHKVYDSEGRFWSACNALKEGQWGPFAELSLVVVDGFTDFTHTQHEILTLLAQKSQRLLLSLPLETPLVRGDLFAKSQGVFDTLRQSPAVTLTRSESAPEPHASIPAALRTVSRSLFANPRTITPSDNAKGIEIVAAAGQQGELNWLAARVKALILTGTPPEDIVVAFRDMAEYRDLLEETFGGARIPHAVDGGIPADRIPLCRAIVQVLRLEADDWPFSRLLAVLDSSFFRPAWPEYGDGRAVRDAAAFLRRYKLAEGRKSILDRLERACRDGEDPAAPRPLPEAGRASLRRALKLLQRLSQATSALREAHDLVGWAAAIRDLIDELGFVQPENDDSDYDEPEDVESQFDQPGPSTEAAAKLLEDLLFDAARAEKLLADQPARRNLARFLPEFSDLIGHAQAPAGVPETGRVRILSAEQVRNLDIPCLFLAGLTERSFPRPRTDDCLYSETERRELNALGLVLTDRAQRAQEEMLLFYNVVTRARRRLILTYPVVTAGGEPLSPSPYLVALQELFTAEALPPYREDRLDPVPSPDRVLSAADARILAMAEALENRPALLGAIFRKPEFAATSANLLAAADMHVERIQTPGFTRFEGMLENPDNLDWIGRRFSPEHEFSATQLEAYVTCPFRFFAEHVLDVSPLATVDIETEHGRRGTIVHDILAELHRYFMELDPAGPPSGPPLGSGAVVAKFHELIRERFGARVEFSDLQQALLEIEERLLRDWGEAYGRQWDLYLAKRPENSDRPLLPAHFETAFGRTGAGPDSPGVRPPLVVGAGDREVRISGRIDRIDVGVNDGRTVFAVIDYKTGKAGSVKLEKVVTSRALQLSLYTLAALRLEIAGPDSTPRQMGFWQIREQGFAPGISQRKKPDERFSPLEANDWDALVNELDTFVPAVAAAMRAGKFPVYNPDDNCTAHCPYSTVCRVNQIRSLSQHLNKTWQV
jgi:ATP-dependent helicase/DNAse subunit B